MGTWSRLPQFFYAKRNKILCQQLLTESRGLHFASGNVQLDGTFKCVPTPFQQLLSVHLNVNSQVIMPNNIWNKGKRKEHVALSKMSFQCCAVAYALMTRRTSAAYIAVLREVRDHLGLTPGNVMSDYEAPLQSAIRVIFPDAQMRGCWFHFTQVCMIYIDTLCWYKLVYTKHD